MKLWHVICKLKNTTHTFNRSAAKSQKPKAKWNQSQKANQNQEPKAKSQVKTKAKAKSQVGMQMGDFSSKMQQIARKSEIKAPKCSK